MKYLLFVILVATLLLVSACGNKVDNAAQAGDLNKQSNENTAGQAAASTTSDEVVAPVDNDLKEADQLDDDLSNDDLDSAINDLDLSDW